MQLAVEVERDERALSAQVVVHAVGHVHGRVPQELADLGPAGDDQHAVSAWHAVVRDEVDECSLRRLLVP